MKQAVLTVVRTQYRKGVGGTSCRIYIRRRNR